VSARIRMLVPVLALTAGLGAGCSSTKVVTAWRAPEQDRVSFTKILAVVVSPDEAFRRKAEDELCRRVHPVACVTAQTAIPAADTASAELAREDARAVGADGIILFRVVSQEEKAVYKPPSPGVWSYYGFAWAQAYNPAYLHTHTLVRVETSVYALHDERLLWVGTTETVDPGSVADLVDDVADAAGEDMREHGLLGSSATAP
jgi:hypothetical protein